jgi:hypothetical protein
MERIFVVLTLLLMLTCPALSQQDYVGRYDAFTGFSYLDSPKLNLQQRGFNGELGVNVTRWLAIGGDYSVFNGHSSLVPGDLTTALQLQLGSILPPGAVLSVPFEAVTQTFSAGPQVNIRKWKPVTLFVRPALGALHERVKLNPGDPLSAAIVNSLVGTTQRKSDTVVFYGFGGGVDLNATRYVAIRLGADFVHTFLFEGLLKESRNSVRLSVGPTFRWGRNVQ